MSQYDKPMKCPFCGETSLHPNGTHSGLKMERRPINGITFLILYCANCGAIVGITKE